MFRTTLETFRALRPPVRALLTIAWIFALTNSMVDLFTQVFLYQKFTSIALNIQATMIWYTGIMIGFTIPGFLAARWRLNLKHGFLLSFIAMSGALSSFLAITTISQAFFSMFLWGLGQGILWLTINTFELSETRDVERDFYSSVLHAGNKVIGVVGPTLAVGLIWLSTSIFHFDTYTLLFSVAAATFALGFFVFSTIRDYRPKPLQWADIRYYFTDRKNQLVQLYTLGTGFQQILGTVVPPLIIINILGTPLHMGIYKSLFAVFSALCVLVIAQYRTPKNRLLIYGVTTLGLALSILWLGYALTFVALVLYTVINGILSPLMTISSHVIDLSAMEIGRSESDFYATMLLRDFFLWVWRCVSGILLLVLIQSTSSEHAALSLGMYLLSFWLMVTYTGAALFLKKKAVS